MAWQTKCELAHSHALIGAKTMADNHIHSPTTLTIIINPDQNEILAQSSPAAHDD